MEDTPSYFKDFEPDPIDEVYPRFMASLKDSSPEKIDVMIGMYRTEDLKPHNFKTTKKVE